MRCNWFVYFLISIANLRILGSFLALPSWYLNFGILMELKSYNMVFHLWCIMYVNISVTR